MTDRWRYQMPLPGGPGGYRLLGTSTHEHLWRSEVTFVVWVQQEPAGWRVECYDNRQRGIRPEVELHATRQEAQAAGERWLDLVDQP